MKKILKTSKEVVMWGAAALLLLFILGYAVLSLRFVSRNLNTALTSDLPNTGSPVTFNLDTAKELLEYKNQVSPSTSATTTPTQ